MFTQSIKFIPGTRSESDLQAVPWHLAQVSSHERTLSQSQIPCTGWTHLKLCETSLANLQNTAPDGEVKRPIRFGRKILSSIVLRTIPVAAALKNEPSSNIFPKWSKGVPENMRLQSLQSGEYRTFCAIDGYKEAKRG